MSSDGDGFLMVGGIEKARGVLQGRAWESSDGSEWTEVDNPLMAQGLQSGPYRDVVNSDGGYVAAAPETTSQGGTRDRFALSYLHLFGPDGLAAPAPYQQDTARVILSSVATFGDQVALAGITFDGDAVRPILVEGTIAADGYDAFRPSLAAQDPAISLTPVPVSVPNEADREAWGPLCASSEAMVAVLALDDSTTSAVRFYVRPADGAWGRRRCRRRGSRRTRVELGGGL